MRVRVPPEKWKWFLRAGDHIRRILGNCRLNRSTPDVEPADRCEVVAVAQRTSESGILRLKRVFEVWLFARTVALSWSQCLLWLNRSLRRIGKISRYDLRVAARYLFRGMLAPCPTIIALGRSINSSASLAALVPFASSSAEVISRSPRSYRSDDKRPKALHGELPIVKNSF
jgi:hypothetical protein